MDERITERNAIAKAVARSYSPSNFPGSKAWKVCQRAQAQLDAYDAANPDVIAQIEADLKTSDAATATEAGWI